MLLRCHILGHIHEWLRARQRWCALMMAVAAVNALSMTNEHVLIGLLDRHVGHKLLGSSAHVANVAADPWLVFGSSVAAAAKAAHTPLSAAPAAPMQLASDACSILYAVQFSVRNTS
jgi:hypothetical protein